jgi:hypothetical protein
MPLIGEMLDRKLLKDIDILSGGAKTLRTTQVA